LIVGSDGYGSFVFVLRDGDDFVEVDCEQWMLVQGHAVV